MKFPFFLLYASSFILGVLSSFSLPPYNIIILNFFTLPILFNILLSQKKNIFFSFLTGWFFGFGYFISNIFWITNSLKFDQNFEHLIPIVLIILPTILGVFYGIVTLASSLFNLKKNFSSLLIFALFFSLIEFIRGQIFTGFPWNFFVFSLTNYLPSLQILSLIGTYSLNLVCITIFLTPLVFMIKIKNTKKIIIFLLLISSIGINHYYGNHKIKTYQDKTPKPLDFNIKIVSPKIELRRFFDNEDIYNRLNEVINLISNSTQDETLFILPENIFLGLNINDLRKLDYVFKQRFSNEDKFILGINLFEDSKLYNALVLLDVDLNILNIYKKNKLVPFGEFLPYESFLSKIGLKKITAGYNSFTASNNRDLIDINNFSILPLICYEIIYSGELNYQNKNFDFIVNISEDGWFGNTVGPIQHFSHAIFRSIEEGKMILRSSNNGISAMINPYGYIEKKIESTNSGVISLKNIKTREKTLFSKLGNKIFFYFVLIYITFISFLKRKDL